MSFHDHQPAPAPAPPPLDLLVDECWFFRNTIDRNKKKPPLPLPPRKSPSTGEQKLDCRRRLLRTPSLPPPRMPPPHPHDDEEQEVEDDDLNWSSIYEGVLRTRNAASSSSHGNRNSRSRSSSSALQRAPSMPVVPTSSSKEKEAPTGNNNKVRHSHSTLGRHFSSNYKHHHQHADEQKQKSSNSSSNKHHHGMMMVRSKSAMFHPAAADKNKWKSSSDLESIEVQGFKDLGFVFDKEELRDNLADVLPGLKNATISDDHHDDGAVRRPYLTEAWHNHRRRSAPPALIRVQSEARSSAEMKDQLRMWAQAVACNVRQECV